MKKISIAGAGLTGCLLAIYLAKRNYQVEVLERRLDMRTQKKQEGRSINLAMSVRGIKPLQEVGLDDAILANCIPMHGRYIHNLSGEVKQQAYGRDAAEFQNSVSRANLNISLLEAADKFPNVNFHFDHAIKNIDVDNQLLEVIAGDQSQQREFECLLACDGSFSAVRRALEKQDKMSFKTETYTHAYKELEISAEFGAQLPLNYLHIWPRNDFMLIALPNTDGTFTCTLFLAAEGDVSFAALESKDAVLNFFNKYFADVVPLIPDLEKQFFQHPTSLMTRVNGAPWVVDDKVLLLGDAAHALVPFLGQGMNASFEDVRLFMNLLTQRQDNWQGLLSDFAKIRKVDADAISDLAVENYYEMRDHVADPRFLLKKALEQELMQRYPEHYTSRYVLISFTHTPYDQARQLGILQESFLDKILLNKTSLEQVDWTQVDELVQDYINQSNELLIAEKYSVPS